MTHADVLGGVVHELTGMSFKNLHKMGRLHAKFGALITAEKHGAIIRRLCEVYFLAPFADEEVDKFKESRGIKDAQSVYFFNETAIDLANEFGVRLPAPVGEITRADMEQLAGGLGAMLYWTTFSVAEKL